ncbi:hypothetical protein EV189_3752 [Motilibacter rhizosphaerae]|uniref:Uncharacterized protein n=1 Tax=Motilibacter rhizosphaerae TaxID=598652 RepID=A0A4Q7NB50_9ACTN|nr:hypothetical protein [Motilibacter rhizosphaerae]RZS79399.1 hypothetical protein EV189_3752 [Motilibacter rhizosphaerae]
MADPQEPPRSRLRRVLMTFFGPADLGPEHRGNPLRGTKYDPELKRQQRRRRARRG